jgi:hypothetical protein
LTIADDGKFCSSCKKLGLQRKAHRIMAGEGGAQCDEHFRQISGLPQLNEKAKLFIAMCKETETNVQMEKPSRANKAKPARTRRRRPSSRVQALRKDRSPTVLDLLDAFNNPLRDPELSDAGVRETPDPESRREPLPGS